MSDSAQTVASLVHHLLAPVVQPERAVVDEPTCKDPVNHRCDFHGCDRLHYHQPLLEGNYCQRHARLVIKAVRNAR